MKLSNSYLLLESNLFHLGEGGEPIFREFFYCYIHMSTQENCKSLQLTERSDYIYIGIMGIGVGYD